MDEEIQSNDEVIDFGDEPDEIDQDQDVESLIDSGDESDAVPQTSQDDDPEEEWEAGGQTYKIKKSELRAGYMKEADYRQKTAKVAEQQRAAEQLVQYAMQERQQRANQLDVLIVAAQRELVGSQPDERMIDENPVEYLRQMTQFKNRTQLIQNLAAERQANAQQTHAMQAQRQQQFLHAQGEQLSVAIPEWRDNKVRTAENKLIRETLAQAGYSAEDIGSIGDHRAVVLARKAALYDQMVAARKGKAAPTLPKPIKPGAAGSSQPNSTKTKALERLSRNPDDIGALAGAVGW